MATFINVQAPPVPTDYGNLDKLNVAGVLAHALGMIDERYRTQQLPALQGLETRLNDLFTKVETRFGEIVEGADAKFGETKGKIDGAMEGIESAKSKFDNFEERMTDASKSFAIYKEKSLSLTST